MSKFLEEHLGHRIPTKELAHWLDLDVDAVRRHYEAFGGIRPIPGGRILFFERNVVDALRGSNHGIKDYERRTYPLEGAGSEAGPDSAETFRHQGGSSGMGGAGAESKLGGHDRYGLLPEALGRKVSGPRSQVRQENLQRKAPGPEKAVCRPNRQRQGNAADCEPVGSGGKSDAGQGSCGASGTV